MKAVPFFFAAALLVGCTSVIKTADKVERGLTPPDAINYVTTKSDGTFVVQMNDTRIGNKIELLAARKSKTPGGFAVVQFDFRNGAFLGQNINVSFEWLSANGQVTERQDNWVPTLLEPGAIKTVTATALKAESAECRLRLISR
jgi:hypothetical protein